MLGFPQIGTHPGRRIRDVSACDIAEYLEMLKERRKDLL